MKSPLLAQEIRQGIDFRIRCSLHGGTNGCAQPSNFVETTKDRMLHSADTVPQQLPAASQMILVRPASEIFERTLDVVELRVLLSMRLDVRTGVEIREPVPS